ncbi:Lon protease C-terminal proteolytic domain-containing protein [Hyaloraphidium curvatum]|nr:Lon protease C-terminal proteolytic domain-containing protein [Hyaloraphidium curvatum]
MQLPASVVNQLRSMIDDTAPPKLADMVASMIDLTIEEKLSVLDTVEPKERIEKVLKLLARQIQVLKISRKLQSTVEGKLGEKQREYILREQLNAIKQELGEKDEEQDEIEDLNKRINDAQLPPEAGKAATRELKRLKRMHPSMAEYQVVRTYLEWLSELPWSKESSDMLDIEKARKVLNDDHYGLDKVKSRILEFLAVRKLKKDLKGPILCLLGPPGVGKTSLGRSIASALDRKFHRIALGGVRDEAEIRGHRRTYIGALPGLVVQGLRRCAVNNPVFLLDEIDKLGRDFRGDPSSALLEVLDPEQNNTFSDHYINVPFDLSKVLFIATANEESTIPGPLLDRMEVIRIPGYTFEEKLHIARRYLLPKQIRGHGLTDDDVKISDEVLTKVATGYTREAGVRNLEREIASVCRGLAVEFAASKENGQTYDPVVTMERLEKILGPDRFDDEVSERTAIPGVVTGLAWTASGSGGLLFIEATQMPGKGQLQLTGKLGDVIKESAQIAVTWVRAHANELGITAKATDLLLDKSDIHIHFPAGATPKDGPSAGVTIATALVSLFTGKPVREHTAMTGEITLRGQVLPVGGIKEKVLAGHRGGIRRIILPFRNKKDLTEIPNNVKDEIEFVFAKSIADVVRAAFDDAMADRLIAPGMEPFVQAKL